MSKAPRLRTATREVARRLEGVRINVLRAIDDLLKTEINPVTKVTVGEALAETGENAVNHIQQRLKTRGLENEKIAAETLSLLSKIEDERILAQAQANEKQAQTVEIRVRTLHQLLDLLERMEPNAIATLYSSFHGPVGTGAVIQHADDLVLLENQSDDAEDAEFVENEDPALDPA